MNTKMKLLLQDRKVKLKLLKAQLKTSKDLICEIKAISISFQKYEQAVIEWEIEKILGQSLESIDELLKNKD
ncbi:hypothetical protein [Leeuwenhoekiella aequorea]|uniref:Uncharacterized protein n=1 Tax=Leeuwenhoekiella aequorea TaxID=283736 RepID=A0A4V1KQM5_9FLAO|nr:hypothetical protein [Leeuwenhoekiella aequorea]RXG21932.1 hypothetical protein DSM00_1996 [Leeuwenhoekiella aequorea]